MLMRTKIRSALFCALLMTVSLVAMRYGRDEGYIPADDYTKSAEEVFFMFDERDVSATALSTYSANNILSIQNAESMVVSKTDEPAPTQSGSVSSAVLPPIVTPPENGLEVFGDSGD